MVKFSVYLNRRVFVMWNVTDMQTLRPSMLVFNNANRLSVIRVEVSTITYNNMVKDSAKWRCLVHLVNLHCCMHSLWFWHASEQLKQSHLCANHHIDDIGCCPWIFVYTVCCMCIPEALLWYMYLQYIIHALGYCQCVSNTKSCKI